MSTPEQRARLQGYLLTLRDMLRLQAWDVEVVDVPASDHSSLDVRPDPRIHWARVRIGSFFDEHPDITNSLEEQRRAAVHEMLHLPQADLLHWLHEGGWSKPLAPDVAALIRERVVEETEQWTELYARVIAEHMPLPPWSSVTGED